MSQESTYEFEWDPAKALSNLRKHGDGDMPDEIDFSGGARGKFHRPGLSLCLPVYLEADVQTQLAAIAAERGVPVSDLANELLKKEIASLESAK